MSGKNDFALTPPMGWNSWDCYGASVREEEVRANADYMAKHLKHLGWSYIVVDIQWYEPNAKSDDYNAFAPLEMDEFSRLQPAVNRFPSTTGGKGFAPLAQYVHSLGLKFGIHILRGIPRQAVERNTTILGTRFRAADIADVHSFCPWNTDMFGVDPSKPGAWEYYDSLLSLYAGWGVDYLKVDDISRPYHKGEVELIRRAIDKTGRPIVLSLSPGAAPVPEAAHLKEHANLWRMSDDFWDSWGQLYEAFDLCAAWAPHVGPGCWPDADMLPLGRIGIRSKNGARMTRFTRDEQKTMMALWSVFRSPWMFGGDMVYNDEWALSLMTNESLIKILNHSSGGHQHYRDGEKAIWVAENRAEGEKYLAQFNLTERPLVIASRLDGLGLEGEITVTDVFEKTARRVNCGNQGGELANLVPPHGVCLMTLKK